MNRKKPQPVVILDAEDTFERVDRHWQLCKKCRDAGMRARSKDLCAKGRELMRVWDETERIYETAEAA
jgi:hypothetical protein